MGKGSKEFSEKQLDLFYRIDKSFTRILNSFIDDERIAEIKPSGLAVLLVLKRFTSWYLTAPEAYANPSVSKIAKLTGMGASTVKVALIRLEELGYINKIKRSNRTNLYALTEKFIAKALKEELKDKELLVPYIPRDMEKRYRELETFEKSGQISEKSPIVVKNLIVGSVQVNIINNADGSQAINVVAPIDMKDFKGPKWISESIQRAVDDGMKGVGEEIGKQLMDITPSESGQPKNKD